MLVAGGGFWLIDGELLAIDEGASDASPINATGIMSANAVGGIGDIDGDGLGDISASTMDNTGNWVQFISGGSLRESARLFDGEPDGHIGEVVGGIGHIDGAAGDTVAVVRTTNGDMATGGDEVWLVSGPMCGTFALQDIGTKAAVRATAYLPEAASAEGMSSIDYGADGGYVFDAF